METRCSAGLHFNPVFGWCDLPENAGCRLGPTPPPPQQHECPPDEALTIIADVTDCAYFFICRHGLSLRERCAPSFLFDRDLRTCRPADEVVC